MDNNDLMRRLRYALQLDDESTARLVALGGAAATAADAAAWRLREDVPGHAPCPDEAPIALLEGLVLERRGPPPATATLGPAPPPWPDNNRVLKRLRVALELRAEEIADLVVGGGGRIGAGELGALFRKRGARNYRPCGDQMLRWFLGGLAARRDAVAVPAADAAPLPDAARGRASGPPAVTRPRGGDARARHRSKGGHGHG